MRGKKNTRIPNDVDSFSNSLQKAMLLPKTELLKMGARGRLWMENDYSWSKIAILMQEGYEWLLKGGTPPDTIKLK